MNHVRGIAVAFGLIENVQRQPSALNTEWTPGFMYTTSGITCVCPQLPLQTARR